ncbi:MAG: drug/metabolite transporter (DMT)-like permease [Paraglaciecola sp.]
MSNKHFIELILLAAIWGASFIFMRSATPEFGPIMLMTLRTGIAAIVLLPFLLRAKLQSQLKIYWRPILFVGLSNTAIPFCLFSYSTLYLGAGYASVLNATAPMFGAVVGFIWLKDNLPYISVFGLCIGFLGVFVLSLARKAGFEDASLLPVCAALLATFLYGVAACYTKTYLQGISPLVIATGSQCFAVMCLAPLSLFFWPTQMPSAQGWLQVTILGLVCTAFAYILYFRLISNVGATKAITVAYLVPVFGVLWGILFLHESLTPLMWAGSALVLTGVAMTTGFFTKQLNNFNDREPRPPSGERSAQRKNY